MRLLVIADYQVDFVDGSLGFPGADKLENKICDSVKDYDAYVMTLDTHDKSYLNTVEGRYLPVEHCISGTKGHELYGKVKELEKGALKIFTKNTFPSLDLANWLKDNPYDEIDLCGLVSNICVISNAIMVKSALPNAKIRILKDLTDSFDKVLEQKAFDVLRGLHIEVK